MNWRIWSQIEALLLEFKVVPLLAVVPDNQDVKLRVGPPHAQFWDEVRKWQSRGWTIGLHGYQHVYVTRQAGIVGISPRSEFAGLPAEEQETKLDQAMAVFRRERVEPTVWVAPSHSFDQATLSALKRIGIAIISDGFALAPHLDSHGQFWIPQQLWKFRWRPFGLWTVCCHHNSWTEDDLGRFRAGVQSYREALTDLPAMMQTYHRRSKRATDTIYAAIHKAALFLRRQTRPTS
jgi:predicted deacetylase